MQNGYQDVGGWTFFKDHDANKTAAAWLYAQFVTAKTTSLKKTMVGLTPDPRSDIQSKAADRHGTQAGWPGGVLPQPPPCGMVAHRHQRALTTPKLAQLWWKNVAQAVTGEKTPQGAMDTLADKKWTR